MTYPLRPATGLKAGKGTFARTTERRPHTRARPLTRKYEVAFLSPENQIEDSARLAPAIPAFEEAFSAFARGTQIATPQGPVAIEDLTPGQPLITSLGDQPLRWRGTIMVVPTKDRPATPPLARVGAETFGPERPFHDLMLAGSARLQLGRLAAPIAPTALIDRESAFPVYPVAPVPVYHLVTDRQALIFAGGVEAMTYHPALGAEHLLSGEMLRLFLSLFPHLDEIEDFGPTLVQSGAAVA